jgi:hypothetical protein
MNTEEVIKAQSELIIHLTERMVLLQTAFEAFALDEFGKDGPKHDAHYELRGELFAQDQKTTSALIRTLKIALGHNPPNQN